MSKIKILGFVILVFVVYKAIVLVKNFEIGIGDRVAKIDKLSDFEKEDEVIGLMMYLGDPPELQEHLFTSSRSKCLELKRVAETNSFAYYECAKINAVVRGEKIIRLIEEIEVFE